MRVLVWVTWVKIPVAASPVYLTGPELAYLRMNHFICVVTHLTNYHQVKNNITGCIELQISVIEIFIHQLFPLQPL